MKGRLTLATPTMATALGVLIVLLMVLGIPLSRASTSSSGGNLSTVFVIVPFALVGVVVAHRQPRNAVGWILLAAGLFFVLDGVASLYAVLDYREHGIGGDGGVDGRTSFCEDLCGGGGRQRLAGGGDALLRDDH